MQKIFDSFLSLSDACEYFNFPINGTGIRKVKKIVQENNIDINHFKGKLKKNFKYNRETKNCPVCGVEFVSVIGNKKLEKSTCSHSCSNTFFRSGYNNPNWKGNYRSVLKNNHKMECVVCGEDKIVSAHHYDENHHNNDPSNLIPLCPTHHQYVHSRYKEEVIGKIEEYRKSFILKYKK